LLGFQFHCLFPDERLVVVARRDHHVVGSATPSANTAPNANSLQPTRIPGLFPALAVRFQGQCRATLVQEKAWRNESFFASPLPRRRYPTCSKDQRDRLE
jgi:hypothetical protein